MGKYTFKLPDIGEGIAEAEIAEWKIAVGDSIIEDQALCDMLTDKAAVEIPSPVAGTVVELKGAAGDKVAVGGALVVLEIEGDGNTVAEEPAPIAAVAAPAKTVPAPERTGRSGFSREEPETQPTPIAAKAAPTPTPARAPTGLPRAEGEKPLASPAVRQRARDLGIELNYVPGTGPAGRITHGDLDAFAARGSGHGASHGPIHAPRTGIEEIRVIGLRRKIAEAMQRSKQRIPHFAYVEEVDVTALESLRTHLNARRRADQPKLTVLPFLMQALLKAVPEVPQVNSTFDDEAGVVYRHEGLHIGIATQTSNGLVVPVVHHAETLDLWDSAAAVTRLAEAARTGKASRDELTGSSITITSLGPMGIVSTPVINAPEVAIIGVNKIVERPMVVDGRVEIRKMMNLSSSFDHRIVDGWDAATFIQGIKSLLENPATLFMPE